MFKLVQTNQDKRERPVTLTISIVLIIAAFLFVHDSAPAQDITSTSVTLHWTAPGDNGDEGTASQYDIRYSQSPINDGNWDAAMSIGNEPVPLTAGSSQSCTIDDLEPSTTYYFAIKAADEVPNWSPLSNILSRTTLVEAVAPTDIADLNAGSATLSSITLNWTAPGDDGGTGTASEYDIRYAASPITDANWNSATQVTGEPSPQSAGSSEQFVVSDLSQNTTYFFAIKTADEVPNWSDLSNVASATTGTESTAPSNIVDLQFQNVTPTSVTLIWHAPGDDGTVGTASEYDIRYSTEPITLANWNDAELVSGEPPPAAAGTAQSYIVSGLNADTKYYFAIRSADEVPNWSGLSNVVETDTEDDVAPSAIMDLSAVTGDEGGQISLSWTAPGDNGDEGIASAYLILYSKDTITTGNWEQADLCVSPPDPKPAGAQQVCVLGNLDPGREYCIAVKSIDDTENMSELSNVSFAMSNTGLILDTDDDQFAELPEEFGLEQNYPNPFNPSTTISYALPSTSHVRIDIYNVLGRLTNRLVDETQTSGIHSISWDGDDLAGNKVSSGIYFYRIIAGNFTDTKKMMLVQ